MRIKSFVLILALVIVSMPSAKASLYEVIDLGAPEINVRSASAINNNGQIAGTNKGPAGGVQAIVWDSTNGTQPLGYIGGDSSGALAISENGQVAGSSSLTDSPPGGCPGGCPYHAFLYDNGVMQDLESLGGKRSQAFGVNNQGQVAGWSDTTGDVHTHAFLYSNGIMQDLEDFAGGNSNSWAYGINNQGQVVGSAGGLPGGRHAFLYEDGTMQDLGTLGGLWSEARAISDNGNIVGSSPLSGISNAHAFLLEDGEMHDLGTFGGDTSHAYAVNNSGQVVGESWIDGNTTDHAFLYYHGHMLDLNELINDPQWIFHAAHDINESGQIIGQGSIDLDGDGAFEALKHHYLLNPTWDALVTTTQYYLTDPLTLGDTFSFDTWWVMGEEPVDKNFDILFFHDGEWKFAGWDFNFDGSSTEWETLSFWVPPWARGLETQIKFVLADLGEYTDPMVYMRNIGSNPVPEPATIFLLGAGLIGLVGFGRKKIANSN